MLGGDREWSTQSTNNFTGVRNEQHGSFGNLCLTVPFLNACGGPNQERSSLPLLTVLLLLAGGHQEEGDGASEREGGTSEVWAPQRSFLPVGRGNLGTFPCLTEEACSPTAPLPFW